MSLQSPEETYTWATLRDIGIRLNCSLYCYWVIKILHLVLDLCHRKNHVFRTSGTLGNCLALKPLKTLVNRAVYTMRLALTTENSFSTIMDRSKSLSELLQTWILAPPIIVLNVVSIQVSLLYQICHCEACMPNLSSIDSTLNHFSTYSRELTPHNCCPQLVNFLV